MNKLPSTFTRFTEPIPLVEISKPTPKIACAFAKRKVQYDLDAWLSEVYRRYLATHKPPPAAMFKIIFEKRNNQLIEMPGDRILNCAVTLTLLEPPYNISTEGTLTEITHRLTNTVTLWEMGVILGLDKLLDTDSMGDIEDCVECLMYCIHNSHVNGGLATQSFIKTFFSRHDPLIDPSKPYPTVYMAYEHSRIKDPTKHLKVTLSVHHGSLEYSYNFGGKIYRYSSKDTSKDSKSDKVFKADACRLFLESCPDLNKFKTSQVMNKIENPLKDTAHMIYTLISYGYFVEYDALRCRFTVVGRVVSSPNVEIRNTCHCIDLDISELNTYVKANVVVLEAQETDLVDPNKGLINQVIELYEMLSPITDIEDPLTTHSRGVSRCTSQICIGQSSDKNMFIYFVHAKVAVYSGQYGIPEPLRDCQCTIHYGKQYSDIKYIMSLAVKCIVK